MVVSKAGSGAPAGDGRARRCARSSCRGCKGDWGSGRVLAGTAFSVVLTDDGRMAAGAVKPELLYDGTQGVSVEAEAAAAVADPPTAQGATRWATPTAPVRPAA